jgi:hypothetical protein
VSTVSVARKEGTEELRQYLLATNYRLPLGGFELDGDGDVVLKYVLLGYTLSEAELKTVLMTIAELADQYDDEIVDGIGAFGPLTGPVA